MEVCMVRPSLAALSFLSVLALVTGCSDDNAAQPVFSVGCTVAGQACTCADLTQSTYSCVNGVAQCLCTDQNPATGEVDGGDGDTGPVIGDGDNQTGDGDFQTGDGDGDIQTGDGDGDTQTGDGDGDTQTGDGDGVPPPPPAEGEPRIPAKPAQCPQIKTGMITVMGQQVQLWVGQKQAGKKGPILFYWHGTGSNSREAERALGNGNSEILAQGGVIASFTTTTRMGQNTGNNVWYTGDFEMADQILACAIEQQDVDPRRIYTGGCSAGGLQASAMSYGRSSYNAAAIPNSGGTVFR
jgi:hypothetical protein